MGSEACQVRTEAEAQNGDWNEAHKIKPKTPNPHTKEFSASHNHKQASTKKTPSGINGSARTAFWPASKAIQAESIEAVILSLSKIIWEGSTVYYCDYVTNVTYTIQYKYPECNFSKVFYRISNQNIPMAEILSELKKGDAGF